MTDKKCECMSCRFSSTVRNLVERSPDEDKKIIEEVFFRMFFAEDDKDYYRMKLDEVSVLMALEGRRDRARAPREDMEWSDKYGMWLDKDTRTPEQKAADDRIAADADMASKIEMDRLKLASKLVKLMNAAKGVLSPCDDSEKDRGYCMGHGGMTRLPCEFAELRAVIGEIERQT
jgi:hypothetical protein